MREKLSSLFLVNSCSKSYKAYAQTNKFVNFLVELFACDVHTIFLIRHKINF
jgi:hypothetical protein